ncbi:MAG: hypothetical protein ACI8Z5_000974 [Lentimonas sp.]|jgi:hypothetical protein
MLCLDNFIFFLRDVSLIVETVKNEGIGGNVFERLAGCFFLFLSFARGKYPVFMLVS